LPSTAQAHLLGRAALQQRLPEALQVRRLRTLRDRSNRRQQHGPQAGGRLAIAEAERRSGRLQRLHRRQLRPQARAQRWVVRRRRERVCAQQLAQPRQEGGAESGHRARVAMQRYGGQRLQQRRRAGAGDGDRVGA